MLVLLIGTGIQQVVFVSTASDFLNKEEFCAKTCSEGRRWRQEAPRRGRKYSEDCSCLLLYVDKVLRFYGGRSLEVEALLCEERKMWRLLASKVFS